jgi:signal transduction histidine kinase/Na+/proline symporter/CheY-like chemotaxis protein
MILILALSGFYLAFLYLLASAAHRRPAPAQPLLRATIYSLSVSLFLGTWFYQSGVSAARFGWNYMAQYLGAVVALTLFFPAWARIAHIVKRDNIGSISDFLSSRYGKSRLLGTLVALVTIIVSLPYLSAQLRSLTTFWGEYARNDEHSNVALSVLAMLLAALAILFGVRRPGLTDHNRGLIRVAASDAVLKLVLLTVLAAVAGTAFVAAWQAGKPLSFGALGEPVRFDGGLINGMVLGLAVMFCAPRQFYVSFIELEQESDLKIARWLTPAIFLFLAGLVIPITLGGLVLYDNKIPEAYALRLAAHGGGPVLEALLFLGITSCVSAVVTVELVALASMVSNELVLPVLARLGSRRARETRIGRVILWIRYLAVISLLLLSLVYCLASRNGGGSSLVASAGLLQLLPALLGGLFWRRGKAPGAIAGILAGFSVWLYYIAGPQFLDNIGVGPGVGFRLAVADGTNNFVEKVAVALSLNLFFYVTVSLLARARTIDEIQAAAFVAPLPEQAQPKAVTGLYGTVGTLKNLVAQFIGPEAAQSKFEELARRAGRSLRDQDRIDIAWLRAGERVLAGAVGASLARNILSWQLLEHGKEPADIIRALDDAAHAVQFNQRLLETTLARLSHGIYVVDREARLKVWNDRYAELSGLPPGFLHVGQPITDVLRFKMERDGRPDGEIERALSEKLRHIRQGQDQDFEIRRADGTVIRTTGAPLPDGHYLTSMSDVTAMHAAASALRRSNEELERNVAARTAELTRANLALAEAKSAAERATNSQGRFLAAASHDLLQPLQAARLFIGALQDDLPASSPHRELIRSADVSIEAANRLLRALLNLSRLEIGGVKPEVQPVDVNGLLEVMRREFEPVAKLKGITLRILARRSWVMSDPDLLRSVLQNLIGNAVRYTREGTVLVACRNDQDGLRFEVRDSGPGIPESAQNDIFKEYSRLTPRSEGDSGTGLGLAIVERLCHLLSHRLKVRSRLGAGSTFSVVVPYAPAGVHSHPAAALQGGLAGLKVLHIDNEASILEGMRALLARWDVSVTSVSSAAAALALTERWDVVFADYRLDGPLTGLDLIEKLKDRADVFALLTANWSDEVIQRAAMLSVEIIRKPIAPASIRTFLTRARHVRAAAE